MGPPQDELLTSTAPVRHHIDKRAVEIAAADVGADDELLTTRETSDWLGISTQWLEIGRCRGYGPPYVRISSRVVRYRRADVRAWLIGRTFASTAAYRRKTEAA